MTTTTYREKDLFALNRCSEIGVFHDHGEVTSPAARAQQPEQQAECSHGELQASSRECY